MLTNETCSSSQILFLNHCSNLFETFFHFCFKSRHSTFVLQDNISVIIIIIITPTIIVMIIIIIIIIRIIIIIAIMITCHSS